MVQFLRILALAACLPLLLPAGLCLCKVGLGTCTNSQKAAAPAPKPCGHDHGDPDGPVEPDSHDHHSHDCPATIKVLERPVSVGLTLDHTGILPSLEVAHSRPTTPRAPRPLNVRPSAAPLYLSHCALLI